jgi:ABC-type polar amino acid transport system ATPase subunit
MEVITSGELELFKTVPRQIKLPESGDLQIFGVSQSGKTTLVFQHLEKEDFLYFDLRNEVDFPKVSSVIRRKSEILNFVFETYNLDISKLVLPKRGRKIVISWKERKLENFQSFQLFVFSEQLRKY